MADDSVAKVLDCLYIGSKKVSKNRDKLEELGITHVVNVTHELRNYFEGSVFKYLKCPLMDSDTADISVYFESATSFIDAARNEGMGVLVHCQHGVSRSASIVVAYLMRYQVLAPFIMYLTCVCTGC